MNKAQERAVERIRTGAFEAFDHSRGEGKYEIKKFEVNEHEYFVSVYAVVGMVGDEGTMAEIICRNKVHFFVGKRGGVTYPVWNEKKRQQVCRQFTGNYYTVDLAQNNH